MTSKYRSVACWLSIFVEAKLHGEARTGEGKCGTSGVSKLHGRNACSAMKLHGRSPGEYFWVSFRIGPVWSQFAAFLSSPVNVSRSFHGRSRFDIKAIKNWNPNSSPHFTHSLTLLTHTLRWSSLLPFTALPILPCGSIYRGSCFFESDS
jgi:hypothetical protein